MSEALQPHGPMGHKGHKGHHEPMALFHRFLWMLFETLPHCLTPPPWFSFSGKEALKMIIVALIEIVKANAPTIFHVDAMARTHFGAIHRHELM